MANNRAIIAVCKAVIRLLETAYKAEQRAPLFSFGLNLPKYSSQSLPAQNTVFLSLYRICPNTSHRIPSGRIMPDGKRQKNQLPIDLHFLLTVWCDDADTQQVTVGWMMRILEDIPILPASHLNEEDGDVFRPDETIEVGLSELSIQDMKQLWEAMTDSKYYLSIPYVVRNVRIESDLPVAETKLVRERVLKGEWASNERRGAQEH
jgi:hypothetical protein